VTELSWDPNEDNLIVSCQDGSMAMITFQGMSAEQTFIANKFENQPNNMTNIVWTTDKSGNFLTSNEKVGTLLMWNVAQKEPL
jgi:hypothetical protein